MRSTSPPPVPKRAEQWFFILIVAFVLLGGQFFRHQVIKHSFYNEKSKKIIFRSLSIPAARGHIYDHNGTPLALSVTGRSLFADPSLIDDPQVVAQTVAPLLGFRLSDLCSKLNEKGKFVWLRRKFDDRIVDRVLDLDIRGIRAIEEPKRVYPRGKLAAHALGFVDIDHKGAAGIECSLDSVLAGKPGWISLEVDPRGRPIPGCRVEEVAAIDGRDVVLTLDATIQEIAETELHKAVEAYSAKGGTALVMDPWNGEILALACEPQFDPNCYTEYPQKSWANPAVNHCHEPGSTFKLVMACAALEEKIMPPGRTTYCPGQLTVGNRVIHCAVHGKGHGHGQLDLAGIIEKSCNVGAATVALMLGPDTYYKYIRQLGFGSPTRVGLNGEARGSITPPQTWSKVKLANLAFGQGISITPLQLLAAYCAVANGGVLPHPHVVRSISQGSRRPPRVPSYPGKRVISPQTASALQDMFKRVVKSGTGKVVQIDGYQVAGKTGTAQKAPYESGKYVGSFVGFLPAEQPVVAIMVVIDEPKGSHYGAVVAAPAFREIAKRTLLYLGVPPAVVAQVHQ